MGNRIQDLNHDENRPIADTRQWILQHRKFIDWIRSPEHSVLRIQGKPGSGKSTLMSYLLHKIKDFAKPPAIACCFFFHDRGFSLQKTRLGLFRSLLHQIIDQTKPIPQSMINDFDGKRKSMGPTVREHWDWHITELEEYWKSPIDQTLVAHHVWILLDALDEVGADGRGSHDAVRQRDINADEARSIIKLFDQFLAVINMKHPPSHFKIHICFASRSYPILYADLKCMVPIQAHECRDKDIETYLLLVKLKPALPETEILKLLRKADGVFIWARLVAERVIRSSKYEFKPLDTVLKEVGDVPEELSNLIAAFLAVSKKIPPEKSLVEGAVKDVTDYEEKDFQHMYGEFKVKTLGLMEFIGHCPRCGAQFIHQIIKDFMVQRGLKVMEASVDDKTKQGMDDDEQGRAHYQLARICIRYFTMREILGDPNLQSLEAPGAPCLPPVHVHMYGDVSDNKFNLGHFLRAYPFLEYAIDYWHARARMSEGPGIEQEDLLDYFYWEQDKELLTSILSFQAMFWKPYNDLSREHHRWHVCQPNTDRETSPADNGKQLGFMHFLTSTGLLGPMKLMFEENNEYAQGQLTKHSCCWGGLQSSLRPDSASIRLSNTYSIAVSNCLMIIPKNAAIR